MAALPCLPSPPTGCNPDPHRMLHIDAAPTKPKAQTAFTDLNPDVLLHIASLASSPSPTLAPHWLNVPQAYSSDADVRALRGTCRHARAAIPMANISVRIRDDWDTHGQLARWVGAPDEVLTKVERVTLSAGRGDYFLSPGDAQSRFAAFATLLARSPALEAVEIAHNPFCPHDAYGLGRDRIFALAPPTAPALGNVHTLSVALKCRICAVEIARTLSSWCPALKALRAAVVTFVPPARVLPPLIAHLGQLRRLHLKVGDEWALPSLLEALAPCQALAELYVSPYDASRKVQVVDTFQEDMGEGSGLDHFLSALAAFPMLEALDLCLSPAAFDPSLADDEDRGPEWRAAAADAALTMAHACPSLRKGWWWIQVVDLDYRQLKGYERWSWVVEGSEVVLAAEPRRLAPLVVRNQDGQGTTVEIPSEEWN